MGIYINAIIFVSVIRVANSIKLPMQGKNLKSQKFSRNKGNIRLTMEITMFNILKIDVYYSESKETFSGSYDE